MCNWLDSVSVSFCTIFDELSEFSESFVVGKC